MKTIKEKQLASFDTLKGAFGYTNKMSAPRITKVVISSGFGRANDRKAKMALVADRLAKIAGQKPSVRSAKKSIASFKLRQGDAIGLAATLRGARMHAFLDKLFHVAVPRMRDFRGFDKKAIDTMGNITLGIPEHTVFPETADEDLRDVFGLAITITTTAKSKAEAEKFFEMVGVPFKKTEEKGK
jgi:large subunit ribosomal protein L5